MFTPLPARFDFPSSERDVLSFWEKHDVFHETVRRRAGSPRFVFYEGPPTANGMPHPGHCLTRVMKDVFPRYKTMCGFLAERKGGWDTHGLPVEREVCKELGIRTKQEIEAYGVEKFNLKCIQSVFRYTREWEEMTRRLAYWVDLKDAYVTFHQSYVESVWWSLKTLFERGVLYQGHKVVWWWAQGGTALSSGEVGEGYKKVDDPSVFVKFPLVVDRSLREQLQFFDIASERVCLLVWTTTPWTLLSNQFAAINPDLQYALVHDPVDDEYFFVASELVEAIARRVRRELLRVGKTCGGGALVALRYHPPYSQYYNRPLDQIAHNWTDQVAGTPVNPPGTTLGNCRSLVRGKPNEYEHVGWRILSASFVSIDAGTGVVHQAPAFGEVDFNLLQEERRNFADRDAVSLICAVNPDGTFNADAPERYRGRWVKECDKDIIRELRDERKTPWGTPLLYHQEVYNHDYPFCPQSPDDPLIQYARKSWFVRTSQFKDEFLKNNAAINWLPEHIKEGRFGDFLRNNVDWALSRERYWGTPLPIWQCESCGKMEAIGSFAELAGDAARGITGKPGATDGGYWDRKVAEHKGEEFPAHLRVHKPYIDEWTYECAACGGSANAASAGNAGSADVSSATGNKETKEQGNKGGTGVSSAGGRDARTPRMRRVTEVIDCWWDAGSMPFAQWGFPHADGSIEKFADRFPADFISEAIDQTRGWFYGLLAISTLLYSVPKEMRQSMLEGQSKTDDDDTIELKHRIGDASTPMYETPDTMHRLAQLVMVGAKTPAAHELLVRAGKTITKRLGFGPHPFKTCIVLGHIAGEDGNKMSKKLRNYKEPTYIFDTLGADAMRWYFLSAQAPWTSTRFAEAAIRDAQREFLVKLYNVLSFFTIYAKIDGFDPSKVGDIHFAAPDDPRAVGGPAGPKTNPMHWRPTGQRTELDRWIVTELRNTVASVRESMDRFENYPAAQKLNDFVDALSNWYVRRSRDRFWRTVGSADVSSARPANAGSADVPSARTNTAAHSNETALPIPSNTDPNSVRTGRPHSPARSPRIVVTDALTIRKRWKLPHWEAGGSTYFLTFRLRAGELSPVERDLVLDACRHWDEQRLLLHAAVVMPDHVHLLCTPLPSGPGIWWSLADLLQGIKGFTAKEINRLRGTSGSIWQAEFYDRIIRNESDFEEKWGYVVTNPARKGLPEDYKWVWVEPAGGAGVSPAPGGEQPDSCGRDVRTPLAVGDSCGRDVRAPLAVGDSCGGDVRAPLAAGEQPDSCGRDARTPHTHSDADQEKFDAYHTLYGCLRVLSHLIAPFTPFFAEKMHEILRMPDDPISIHMCDYPTVEDIRFHDAALAATMNTVRDLVALGRAARTAAKLKVRQPLSLVEIILAPAINAKAILDHAGLIAEELNVKRVELAADADKYVTYKVVPNFKAIGSKFRAQVPGIKDALGKLPDAASARRSLLETGALPLTLADGANVSLSQEEVEIRLDAKPGWAATQGRPGVVVLSTEVTPELRDEGVVRELIHFVQAARKEQNLAYEARIVLHLEAQTEPAKQSDPGKQSEPARQSEPEAQARDSVKNSWPAFQAIVRRFEDTIKGECLLTRIDFGPPSTAAATQEIDVEGHKLRMAIVEQR